MENSENTINYQRIEKAIQYILDHQEQKPSLENIAKHIHLSPFHFQRLFQEWAGTTPKKFLQYISLSRAKKLLADRNSIQATSDILGLSSGSRLYDLFVNIEAMTPAEYNNGGISLNIKYSFHNSPFGELLIASTGKGICNISFISNKEDGLKSLKKVFPQANYESYIENKHLEVLQIFNRANRKNSTLNIHIKGSNFQIKVWEALLQIPYGHLQTYGDIAKSIHQPTAARAVGTAIGANPLAYLIPCHRVIQASGVIGGYMWNPIRKTAIIGWESAQSELQENQ